MSMDRDNIFRVIQQATEDPPLFLIGSGCSAPHGLPNMKALGVHLLTSLSSKYNGVPCWDEFRENIENGDDLETALSRVTLTDDVLRDIRCETWNLITKKDLDLFAQVLFSKTSLPLARMLKKFYQAHPRKIDIITTNYDRVIEYACDSIQIPVVTGFNGCYSKCFSGTFSPKNAVNLIKVHGSLDVFQDSHGATVAVPMLQHLQPGLTPEIITPGLSKYETILQRTYRQLLITADECINQSKSFMCIGYGFNDTQIQDNIINRIRLGVPIIVLSMEVSELTARLLANNATRYISIQKGTDPNTTEICIDREIEILDGTFWTIDGFMDIID